jgi:hypothetical protein
MITIPTIAITDFDFIVHKLLCNLRSIRSCGGKSNAKWIQPSSKTERHKNASAFSCYWLPNPPNKLLARGLLLLSAHSLLLNIK